MIGTLNKIVSKGGANRVHNCWWSTGNTLAYLRAPETIQEAEILKDLTEAYRLLGKARDRLEELLEVPRG